MPEPAQIDVWIGLDVGKEFHHAVVLDDHGDTLIDRRVSNDEADVVALLETAAGHGTAALVIDQPGSIAHS